MAKYSVNSFPPELLEVLKIGSTREVIFNLPYKACVNYRADLYSLRAALRREGHTAAEVVNVVEITIKPSKVNNQDEIVTLRIAPRNMDFANLIRQELALDKQSAAQEAPKSPMQIGEETAGRNQPAGGEFDYLSQILSESEDGLDLDGEDDTEVEPDH